MNDEVCFIGTWDVPCGIAGYTADLREALEADGVSSRVIAVDKRITAYLSRAELAEHFLALADAAAGASVVHIQHEFSFFAGSYGMAESIANFGRLLKSLHGRCGQIVVTFHSLPVLPGWRSGSGRSMVRQALLRRLWRRNVLRPLNRRGVLCIAPSRYLRRTLIDSGVRSDVITVIPQGSPAVVVASDEQRLAAKRQLGYADDDLVLALFGFVSPYKGHAVALDALEGLPENYKLAIVGGPHPENTELGYELALARASSDDLDGRARVTGYVPLGTVRAYLTASDMCLLPYVDSGMATSAAAMWALSSGRPVLASKIPAFRELNDAAECLRLVNPEAPNELARAVLELTADSAQAARLVERSVQYCAQNSWPAVATLHARLYGVSSRPQMDVVGQPMSTCHDVDAAGQRLAQVQPGRGVPV